MRKIIAGKKRMVCSECGKPIQWLQVEYKVFECSSDNDLPTEECAILADARTLYDTVRLFCGCEGHRISDLIEQLKNLCERPGDAKNRSESNTGKDAAQSISEQ